MLSKGCSRRWSAAFQLHPSPQRSSTTSKGFTVMTSGVDHKQSGGTGGDPAGGADPGGTRPTKSPGGADQATKTETGHGVQSGDRNDMTKSDPIKP